MHNVHTLCGTVLRTNCCTIRHYANSEGGTGRRGNFRLSHASPRHIRTAQVITQPQKIHSQLVGLVRAVMYLVAGLTCSFDNGMDLQPAGVIHNNLAFNTHTTYFSTCERRPSPQLRVWASAIKRLDAHVSLNHVSFRYSTIKPDSTQNATQQRGKQNMCK